MANKSLKAQTLLDSMSSDYKYLTKDKDGQITAWKKRPHPVGGCWLYKPAFTEQYIYASTIGRAIEVAEFSNVDWAECIYERKTNPADWIGSLCKFYTDNRGSYIFGVLSAYTKGAPYPFQCLHAFQNFARAEIAKPDEFKFFEQGE